MNYLVPILHSDILIIVIIIMVMVVKINDILQYPNKDILENGENVILSKGQILSLKIAIFPKGSKKSKIKISCKISLSNLSSKILIWEQFKKKVKFKKHYCIKTNSNYYKHIRKFISQENKGSLKF